MKCSQNNCVCNGKGCPSGMVCCSEKVPDGGKPTFGQCCKNCNHTTGVCNEMGKEKQGREDYGYVSGGGVLEGYSSKGSDCNKKYLPLIISLAVLCIIIVALALYYR